ncbi:hypothetical protein Dehly_0487 [Dehalogenimonas lykanthroporepellens BL-DC-9]|nr:hypothetical protein Dehly_0487 [Dehalogenimonas lykanthroporepellens BL-DC-9]
MTSVIGTELHKLAASRFTWIAPLILLLYMFWGMSGVYSQYQLEKTAIPMWPEDPPPGVTLERWQEQKTQFIASQSKTVADLEKMLTYPSSIGSVAADIQWFGGLLIIGLAVSAMAGEFRHGTIAQIIARGTTRRRFVLGKIGALSIVTLGWIVVAVVFGFFLSLYYGAQIGEASTVAGSIPDILVVIGFTWLTLLIYVLAGVFLAMVFKSGMVAIATGIFLFMFDWLFITFGMPGSGASLAVIRNYAPNFNIISVMHAIMPGEAEFTGGYLMRWGSAAFDEYPDPSSAALVLAFYALIFAGVSMYIMSRRELKVA